MRWHNFWPTRHLQREVLLLRNRYNTCPQTLIHNDFHTSNICVGETAVKIFDAEGATFGPIGFDLGRLIGNLILNYASWEGIDTITFAEKDDFRDYLLAVRSPNSTSSLPKHSQPFGWQKPGQSIETLNPFWTFICARFCKIWLVLRGVSVWHAFMMMLNVMSIKNSPRPNKKQMRSD